MTTQSPGETSPDTEPVSTVALPRHLAFALRIGEADWPLDRQPDPRYGIGYAGARISDPVGPEAYEAAIRVPVVHQRHDAEPDDTNTADLVGGDEIVWRDLSPGELLQEGDRIMDPKTSLWTRWDGPSREVTVYTYPCQRRVAEEAEQILESPVEIKPLAESECIPKMWECPHCGTQFTTVDSAGILQTIFHLTKCFDERLKKMGDTLSLLDRVTARQLEKRNRKN